VKYQRVTTNCGPLSGKRLCSIVICIPRHALLSLKLLPGCIYIYVDVWRWTSGDSKVTSFFTAIPRSGGAVYIRPLKCVTKCEASQSFVNTSLHSGRRWWSERLLRFAQIILKCHSLSLSSCCRSLIQASGFWIWVSLVDFIGKVTTIAHILGASLIVHDH
jgi:hypothetical protein